MNPKQSLAVRKAVHLLTLTLCVLVFPAVYASAGVITFSGEDIMTTTTSTHPNSTAAAANFATAAAGLGTIGTITFEGAPLGAFSSLAAAPGVTITGTDYNGNNQTIRNTSNSPTIPTLDGYNTTPGGSYFLEMQAGTVTFTFSTPVDYFGAYFSGVQYFFSGEDISFSDGTTETISIPETDTSSSVGALDFVGFTDAGKSITSITIDAGVLGDPGADYIGIDDVMYQAPAAVTSSAIPEPNSILLMLTGSLGLAATLRRRLSI